MSGFEITEAGDMKSIKFTVPGNPFGKQRPKFARMGTYTKTYTPKETTQHEKQVETCFLEVARGRRFKEKEPLDIRIIAYYPIPQSTSKKRHKEMLEHRIRPTVKPDLDNVAKLIYDALNGVAWHDDMAMAGWNAEQMMGGIEGILNLAAASGEDLGTTSDIVTDALTAFGLKASDATHFSDVLAQASSSANTDVGMMGETFKYVASMAGSLSYSIEDVALMTGLMANSGIKSTQAGTSLNSVLTRLATNSSGAADAMLAKLKQSHTTYIVNNYSSFEIDNRELEKMLLKNIRITARIPFWRTRLFDGSEIMDGSHLMNAEREYDLRLGVMYREGEFKTEQTAILAVVAMTAKVALSEQMNTEKMTAGFRIDFWRSLYFDGSILMNGKNLMNYSRQEIKTTGRIKTSVQVPEEFGNVTVTSRRNLAYFDGSLKMDGSRLMNSINQKEAI